MIQLRKHWLAIAYCLPVAAAVGVLMHDEWKRAHGQILIVLEAKR